MARDEAGPEFAESQPELQESQLRHMAQRWRLVLGTVFLALALLVWLAAVEEASHERRLTLSAVAERDSNLATAVEHYLVRVLRTARAVNHLLGGLMARGRSEAEMLEVLADRLRANDVFRELGLCLADGRVLPQPAPGARLTAAACASISARVRSGSEVAVLPPLGPAGALQVPLALALDDPAGRRLAVAVALTPAETMLGVMQAAVLHDETTVLVTGADGSPRAAWHSRSGHVTDPASLAAWASLPRRQGGTASVHDRTFLVSSRAMHDADLRIHVASASEDALAGYRGRRTHLFVLCLLLTLCLAGTYRMLSRMHARSLSRARALTRARAQLQALNEGLDNQVQERTAQLEQAYHDLETFSYAVAHDVRAPLAAIAGFASALEPAVAGSGNPKHLHYLQRIRANAAQMEELTTHLLELGRLTQAPLVRDEVDLSALANEVLARLREADPHRQVEATVEAGLRASGDRALLRQVLENLLGNAWKFSSRRARAHIAFAPAPAAAEGGENVFVVSDDGEGFDSEQATGLFRPFRRMHGSGEFPGSGVGLAAVQRIVVLHGGRVWCESRPGAGARFYFSLPG